MTASARDARLLKTARQILEEAGRPLSVRRILRAGEQEERFEGEPTLAELRAALVAGIAEGVVEEARRGIFALASGDARPEAEAKPAPSPEPPAVDAAPADAPRRRRRTPPAEGPAETPSTLDEAAALSAADDRKGLKDKLWARLQLKASRVTDQPIAEAPRGADAASSEDEPESPSRGRRRRRRDAEDDGSGEKPRRRRRRSPSAGPAEVAEAPAAAEPAVAEDGEDPRARLKARLARRTRPSKSEPEAVSTTEASAQPAAEATSEPAGSDARSLLKRRLAARSGAVAEAPQPAVAEAASEAAPGRRRRRRGRKGDEPTTHVGGSPATPSAAEGRPAAEPARSGPEGDPRARLKARLAARAGETPSPETPADSAPAGALTPAASTPPADDARSALKARLAARAGRPPAETEPTAPAERAPTPPAERAPTLRAAAPAPTRPAEAAASDPRAALRARLASRRGGDPAPAAPTVQAPAADAPKPDAPKADRSTRAGAREALKARLAARRDTPDPLEVPLAESRRPYREKREAAVEPEAERRTPSLPESTPISTLVAAALDALRGNGSPMAIDALAARVDSTAEGGAGGLRIALRAENARREQAGLRPLFVAHYGGDVGLTEWGLSARYRALENQIQEAVAEQRELVRRDLLARIGDLTDGGFERVITMLLEQLGHRAVTVVHRQAGTVALTVERDGEDGGTERIAVVARRSWGPIKDGTVRRLRDTLAHFEADSGLVMTVGTFASSARGEARRDGLSHVRLIDGAGLAGLLYDNGIGLSAHRPVMRHLDVVFFASLEA